MPKRHWNTKLKNALARMKIWRGLFQERGSKKVVEDVRSKPHRPGGLLGLPPELTDSVLSHLASAGPPQEAADLARLRRVSRHMRDHIDNAGLSYRIQAFQLAKGIFKSTYPEQNALSDLPNQYNGLQVGAGQRISSFAAVAHLLADGEKDRVIDDMRKLANPLARAQAFLTIARDSEFSSWGAAHRDFLVQDAIGILSGPRSSAMLAAAEGLAHIYQDLDVEQRAALEGALETRPGVRFLFEGVRRHVPIKKQHGPVVPNLERCAAVEDLVQRFNDVPITTSDASRVVEMAALSKELAQVYGSGGHSRNNTDVGERRNDRSDIGR